MTTNDFQFDKEDDGSLSLESAVYQALGRASTCWESMAGTGVFDDAAAHDTGQKLLAFLKNYIDDQKLRTRPLKGSLVSNMDPRLLAAEPAMLSYARACEARNDEWRDRAEIVGAVLAADDKLLHDRLG